MPRCQDCQAEIVGDGNAYRSSSVSMEKPEKVSIGAHFKYQLGKMRTNLPSQGKVLISIGIIGLVGGGFFLFPHIVGSFLLGILGIGGAFLVAIYLPHRIGLFLHERFGFGGCVGNETPFTWLQGILPVGAIAGAYFFGSWLLSLMGAK